MISVGTSILGALFGRKLASSANVTRAASSMRSAGRVARERADVGQAEETVESLQQQLGDLESQFKTEADAARQAMEADQLVLEPLEIKPRKNDISVEDVVLAWTLT